MLNMFVPALAANPPNNLNINELNTAGVVRIRMRNADQAAALDWITRHGLTGVLTEYEVGDGCYDLAVRQGRFRPTKPHHGSARHVAGFSSGLGHVHVQDGQPDP